MAHRTPERDPGSWPPAETAQVAKQTAGFPIGQLKRASHVERTPDLTDARARLVRITECGAAAIPTRAKVIAAIEAEWTTRGAPVQGAAL